MTIHTIYGGQFPEGEVQEQDDFMVQTDLVDDQKYHPKADLDRLVLHRTCQILEKFVVHPAELA